MVRGWYNNMLRAKAVDVTSDSGSSAGEATDSDSDGMAERRRQRRLRRNRVKEQVTALRRKPLPKAHKDVDEVTQWMDTMMYTNSVCLRSRREHGVKSLIIRRGSGWSSSSRMESSWTLQKIKRTRGPVYVRVQTLVYCPHVIRKDGTFM